MEVNYEKKDKSLFTQIMKFTKLKNCMLIANGDYIQIHYLGDGEDGEDGDGKYIDTQVNVEGKWERARLDNNDLSLFGLAKQEDLDNLDERISNLSLKSSQQNERIQQLSSRQKQYPKSQSEMKKMFKDVYNILKTEKSENLSLEEEVSRNIRWIEDSEQRSQALKDILGGMKNNSVLFNIYYSLKSLSVWRELYIEKKTEREFRIDINSFNDSTKPYLRLNRFVEFFEKLPAGSFAICNIPTSYWRNISADNWNELKRDFV